MKQPVVDVVTRERRKKKTIEGCAVGEVSQQEREKKERET